MSTPIKVWVTKHWKTSGITEALCEITEEKEAWTKSDPRIVTVARTVSGWPQEFLVGVTCFLAEEEAIAQVEKERQARIAELQTELSMLQRYNPHTPNIGGKENWEFIGSDPNATMESSWYQRRSL